MQEDEARNLPWAISGFLVNLNPWTLPQSSTVERTGHGCSPSGRRHGRPVLLLHYHGALVADRLSPAMAHSVRMFLESADGLGNEREPGGAAWTRHPEKKISLAEIKSVKAIDIPLTNRRQLWLCGKGRALQIITRDDEVLQFGSSDPETLVSFLEK